jgi:hypothetical protein
MKRPLYQLIAHKLSALETARVKQDADSHRYLTASLARMADDCLPSGNGLDRGTTLDVDRSTPERIVMRTAYHHMHESGMYDGWTDHEIVVTPSLLSAIAVRVKGPSRGDIRDYLATLFYDALTADVDPALIAP